MNYAIHITDKAKQDLAHAVNYIEFTLLNPQAADDLLSKVEKTFNNLTFMPAKHKIVDDPILSAWGIRLIVINNYLAFYLIDESAHTIHILRFLYKKRNWNAILRNSPMTLN